MTKHPKLLCYSDGGARGNPGPAGIGAVLRDPASKAIIATVSTYLGPRTNNQAEYEGILAGLQKAKELGATHVDCFLDSQLIAEQLSGRYKVKDSELAKLFVKTWNEIQQFEKVTFTHIPREQNTEADRLVNAAIDTAQGLI